MKEGGRKERIRIRCRKEVGIKKESRAEEKRKKEGRKEGRMLRKRERKNI